MDYDFMPKNGMCTRKIEKQMVRKWWEYLQTKGPDYGYYAKPALTILIIKDNSLSLINAIRTKILQKPGNQNENHRPR